MCSTQCIGECVLGFNGCPHTLAVNYALLYNTSLAITQNAYNEYHTSHIPGHAARYHAYMQTHMHATSTTPHTFQHMHAARYHACRHTYMHAASTPHALCTHLTRHAASSTHLTHTFQHMDSSRYPYTTLIHSNVNSNKTFSN